MKNVINSVVFMDGNDNVCYAVKYTGVMTRRTIYAKLTSFTGSADTPLFVKIARKDTEDTTANWSSNWKGRCREIRVHNDLGLKDPRIQEVSELPDEILTAVLNAVNEEKEIM